MTRPPVTIEKRQRLSKYEFAEMFLAQNGRCACGCGERLERGKVDEEHSKPVALGGDAKPDSLWRRDCHKAKTRGDVKVIAKVERIAGRKGQYARRKKNGSKIQSANTLGGEQYKARKEWAERVKRDGR